VHTGPYNVWELDGLEVDERHNLRLVVLDGDYTWRNIEILGEYASASIDVPAASSLLADSQSGFYVQSNVHFGAGWLPNLPESILTGVVRYGSVDFDNDADGDSHDRLTLGLNLRPIEDAAFKLDYQRNWERDGFDNEEKSAALLFSVATYF
jgi:hypothetical protein